MEFDGCDVAVKLVNKAVELQENMSTNNGKMYSRSHVSEKAESAPRRVEQGDGGPNTARHRARDEQAASSNVAPL